MNKRLILVRNYYNFAQNKFAELLGINKFSYANYERGTRNISFDVLEKLHRQYKVNLNWLIVGSGEMFVERTIDDEILDGMKKEQDQFKKSFEEIEDKLEEKILSVMKKYGVVEK